MQFLALLLSTRAGSIVRSEPLVNTRLANRLEAKKLRDVRATTADECQANINRSFLGKNRD